MEHELDLDDNSAVAKAHEIQNNMVIMGMADARTLELFKGGKGESMIASGGASRRTGFEGSVGASTVNPDFPIRKKEAHKKRLMENAVMKGNLADNKVHNRQLEDQIQSLTEISAPMAALLDNSDDVTAQVFQDKMKKPAENFKTTLPAQLMLKLPLLHQPY